MKPLSTGFLGILGLGVFVAAGLAPAAQAAPETMTSWLEEMRTFYDLHPELKQTKGSGWKPYNRAKWFYEQRMVNGEEVPVGARFEICKIKNELERANGASARSTWFTLGPTNFAGRILDLEFDPLDPSKLYASGADGGLWRTTDNGVSWTPLSDETGSLAVGAICVLPSDPDIILIGTGEPTNNVDAVRGVGVLRSTDAGATWNPTSLTYGISQGHGFHVMEANPITGTILAGATDGLWRSSDNGQNWTNVRPEDGGTNYFDVVWKPGSATQVFTVKGSAGGGNGVKVSTDDGLTFVAGGAGPPGFSVGKSKLAISPADPNKLYALFTHTAAYNALGTYLSTNDGATFTLRSDTDILGEQGWYNLILGADPNNADRLICGGVDFFRSINGGTTWTEIGNNVHVDHHAIRWKPGANDEVWVGNDGGVYQSTNDGTTWTDRNSGLVTYQFYDICVSQFSTNFIMGGTQDNGTDRWTGTTTWLNGLGGDGMVCNINPNIGTTVYAEIQFGNHRKSTNSGQTFFNIMSGIPGNNQQWVVPVAEDQTPGNGDHLYTHHSSDGIYRTTNGGALWENVAPHNTTWIDISPINGNYVFTTGGSTMYSTNDGGSWAAAAPFGFVTGGATKVLADPVDLNTVYVTFSGYGAFAHVARSTDLGASWTDITGDLPGMPTNAIAVDNQNTNHIYIGTDAGVWRTTDGGANWLPYEVGFPNAVVVDLELQTTSRKLIAGTHGRGAWEVDITATTGVEVVTPGPLNLMLDPPSPNPVTSETVLRFAAKHPGNVNLSIFDVTGRLVNEVVRGPVGDGIIRMVPWYADDVPSGVYFVVLQAGPDRISRKIVVTK